MAGASPGVAYRSACVPTSLDPAQPLTAMVVSPIALRSHAPGTSGVDRLMMEQMRPPPAGWQPAVEPPQPQPGRANWSGPALQMSPAQAEEAGAIARRLSLDLNMGWQRVQNASAQSTMMQCYSAWRAAHPLPLASVRLPDAPLQPSRRRSTILRHIPVVPGRCPWLPPRDLLLAATEHGPQHPPPTCAAAVSTAPPCRLQACTMQPPSRCAKSSRSAARSGRSAAGARSAPPLSISCARSVRVGHCPPPPPLSSAQPPGLRDVGASFMESVERSLVHPMGPPPSPRQAPPGGAPWSATLNMHLPFPPAPAPVPVPAVVAHRAPRVAEQRPVATTVARPTGAARQAECRS